MTVTHSDEDNISILFFQLPFRLLNLLEINRPLDEFLSTRDIGQSLARSDAPTDFDYTRELV